MNPLELILKYEMTSIEAKAYKICLLWENLVEKEFPGERCVKLKKSGDPRKSSLFRYAYKLARETNGLILDKEYKLYIIAQLHVLKTRRSGDVHALIEPQILVGDRAWRRWKLWKRHYDRKLAQHADSEELGLKEKENRIFAALERTKKFLEKEGVTTLDTLQQKVDDLSMIRWITLGKVSPYYAALSPMLQKALGGKSVEEVYMFDLGVYRSSITPEIEQGFEEMFGG